MLGWLSSIGAGLVAGLLAVPGSAIGSGSEGVLTLTAVVLAALVTAAALYRAARPKLQPVPIHMRADAARRRRATCRTYATLDDPGTPGRPRPRAPGR